MRWSPTLLRASCQRLSSCIRVFRWSCTLSSPPTAVTTTSVENSVSLLTTLCSMRPLTTPSYLILQVRNGFFLKNYYCSDKPSSTISFNPTMWKFKTQHLGRWEIPLIPSLTFEGLCAAVFHVVCWTSNLIKMIRCHVYLTTCPKPKGTSKCREMTQTSCTDFIYRGHGVEPSGTPLGCTTLVKEGAVPNEHGTWLYGRGGWCDGLQVNPWRIDITKQVCPSTLNSIHLFLFYFTVSES